MSVSREEREPLKLDQFVLFGNTIPFSALANRSSDTSRQAIPSHRRAGGLTEVSVRRCRMLISGNWTS
jgi:hypothetical protein